jgi:hypothetical protein
MINPFVGLPSYTWPYLQAFNTQVGIIIASKTNFYTVSGSYALTSQLSVSSRNQRWDCADFGGYLVFANGGAPVERYLSAVGDPPVDTYIWRQPSVTYTVNSVCNFNGQLIGGGFGGAANVVAWSRIGYADITNLLGLDSNGDWTNTSGKRAMEWDGEVYHVMKLGNAVIVYGSGGVSIMPAVSQPAVGFGYKNLNKVGLCGRYAVGGNENVHLWVDKAGWVWLMKGDYSPKLLGYQEWILSEIYDLTKIVVSYNEAKDDFYISDGETTFLVNERGMTQIFQHPTSCFSYGGGIVGIMTESVNITAEVATDRLDMLNKDIKLITTVEADVDSDYVYCAIDYRFNKSQDFVTSQYKKLNKMGFVTPIISGVDLRVRMKWTDYLNFSLGYILVRFKQVDKRSIRGTYVMPKGGTATV